MKKNILLICLCSLFIATAFAQEQKQMRWLLKVNMGYSVPLMKFPRGHTTDNILGSVYSNNTYFQFPSITFFINQNWGIESSGAPYLYTATDKYEDVFAALIENRYPDYYNLGRQNSFNDSKVAIRIGPVYKWEQGRFVFICGLPLISFMNVDTPSANFSLKRKNSNDMLNLSYSTNNEYDDIAMYNISPYFTVGYRLASRIILNVEGGFNLYKAKFKYTETERNLITGKISTQHFSYNKWVGDLNFGVGLQFVLKNKR